MLMMLMRTKLNHVVLDKEHWHIVNRKQNHKFHRIIIPEMDVIYTLEQDHGDDSPSCLVVDLP